MSKIYLIGSLRNPEVPVVANRIRQEVGHEVFDNWHATGPAADDYWKDYSKGKGQSYKEALNDFGAKHIFEFDKFHIDRADIGVLLMAAGKSGHLELGYMIGQGKPCYYVMEPDIDRWDVMLQFCYLTGGSICDSVDELIECLK